MATTIKLKNGSGAPTTGDLVQGEPAFDLTNKRLYTEDSGGAIIEIGTSPSTIDINAGTIDGTVIGGASAAALTATTITGTNITANSTVTINNDGGSSFSHSRIILDSNGASRAAGIFSHNQVNDTEWFFGNPYDTPDSFAINRQATASHNDSTSNKTNSLVTVSSAGNVGIGSTAPTSDGAAIADNLVVKSTGSTGITITSPDANNATLNFGSASDNDYFGIQGFYNSGSPFGRFSTGGTERMRIDSNGQIMIAGSTTAFDTTATANGLQAYYETDTGLATLGSYSSGGSTSMTFHTNSGGGASAEAMRIDSSGQVGIGVTSMSSILHTDCGAPSSSDKTLALFQSQSSRQIGFVWDDSASTLGIANFGSQSLAFHVGGNSSEKMRIDSSGNVGIGDTTPSSGAGWNKFVKIAGGTSNAVVLDGTDSQEADLGAADGLYISVAGHTTGSNNNIIFRTQSANSNYTGAERMRIDSAGKVGIGTTAPQYALSFGTGYFGLNYSTGKLALYQANSTSHSTAVESIGSVEISSSITGSGAGAVKFNTLGSERMRISSAGDFLIGTTVGIGSSSNTANNFTFAPGSGYAWFSVSNAGGIYIQRQNDGSVLTFYRATAAVGSITVDASAPTTNYLTTSDARVKENIVDAPAGNIDAIRVRSFDWKDGGSHQKYGMVAQELVDVAPEAVTQGETEDDMWGVDYSKLVPMMIKEIQDLKAEVAALKGE